MLLLLKQWDININIISTQLIVVTFKLMFIKRKTDSASVTQPLNHSYARHPIVEAACQKNVLSFLSPPEHCRYCRHTTFHFVKFLISIILWTHKTHSWQVFWSRAQVWLGRLAVRVLDWPSCMVPKPGHCASECNFGQVLTHVPLVTKQYNW